jgi:hypothetical protein
MSKAPKGNVVKKIYYEKKGRRYIPVAEYNNDLLDSFTKGNHLVMCYPGGTSRRFNIDPAYAPMIAAGRVAEDAISKTIMEKSALRVPEKHQPLTPEQSEAWHRLSELFGNERYALEWCSYREAAEAGVKAMQDEADKLMKHNSVRRAYEQFLIVCELVKENND